MQSVISYPERGKWGNNKYRGNCSGYVIVDLIQHFMPKTFMDITEGGGTSRAVCQQYGVKYIGLDLQRNFDFVTMNLLQRCVNPADMVFSHPPYHDMIKYSDRKEDLSNCKDVDEFIAKLQVMLYNQRYATKQDGYYVSLIGDYRKRGKFHSFQGDMIKMMPRNELISVTIKMQHNMMSNNRTYTGNFVPIIHEYLLIWKKSHISYFKALCEKIHEYNNNVSMTWRSAVRLAMMQESDKEFTLEYLYTKIVEIVPEKTRINKHYKEKVRQTLQLHFTHVKRGIWSVENY